MDLDSPLHTGVCKALEGFVGSRRSRCLAVRGRCGAAMVAVPNVWPLGNIYNIWLLDPSKAGIGATSKGAWYMELFVRHLRLSTYILLSLFIYTYLWPKDLQATCSTFAPGWVGMVFARNVAVGWLLYGGWHWILYDSVSSSHGSSR